MVEITSQVRKSRKIRPDHFERLRETTHVLYRCFNRKGDLLYVGMTNHPEQRFKHHEQNKIWWKYVDHITLTDYPNRKALSEAEAGAIATENPKFNITQPYGTTLQVNPNRRKSPLWSEPSTFGVVVPETGFLIEQTLEQQLYPCVECHARAIYCRDDVVACKVCSAEWSFTKWFKMTFRSDPDTPVGNQIPLM